MKKIIIGKTETVASIIEQVMATSDSDVILVVPRDALLKGSLNNFRTIKRETEAVQRSVAIESVDEEVLALATAAGLTATHPLFRGGAHTAQPIIDLRSLAEHPAGNRSRKAKDDPEEDEEAEYKIPSQTKEEDGQRYPSWSASGQKESNSRIYEPAARSSALHKDLPESEPKRPSRKLVRLVLIALAALLAIAIVITMYFNRGSVSVSLRRAPWTFSGQILADKSLAKPESSRLAIPGEIFNQTRNVTQLFPASGTQNVSEKASGRINIYNAYSSEKQTLVKTTRFVTEDGRVYRLTDQVIVPGAEIKDGKIIPASIQAAVVADQPGAEYNRTKTERMNIPGFKGTPKYAGFYGEVVAIEGGLVGQKRVPTAQDITTAKEKTSEILQSSLRAAISSGEPQGFTILPGATEIEITKLTAGSTTDENGNFSIFGEARFRGIGFRDSLLKEYLSGIATQPTSSIPNAPLELEDLKLNFATSTKPDFIKGSATFGLEATGTLRPTFKTEEIKESLAGKSIEDAKKILADLPGLVEATASVWPFWISTMPSDPAKITIELK